MQRSAEGEDSVLRTCARSTLAEVDEDETRGDCAQTEVESERQGKKEVGDDGGRGGRRGSAERAGGRL